MTFSSTLRTFFRLFSILAGWAALGIAGGAAQAMPVDIPEKYADAPTAAWFPEGKVGRCLAVFTGAALEYPVWFNRTNAPEGTLSCWFKPTRAMGYDGQYPVALTEIGGIAIYGDDTTPLKRMTYPGGQRSLSNDFYQSFHHMVFTWSPKGEQTWLDGQCVYEKAFANQPAPARAMANATIGFHSTHGCLLDEVLVLDRAVSPAEARELYQTPKPWTMDSNTVFYAGMEGTMTAQGWVKEGGDVLRMATHIGRVDATFRAGDKAMFTFAVLNTTPAEKSLVLKGIVKDLEKKTVLEKYLPIKAKAGELTPAPFPMDELSKNGLFWGHFALEADGRTVQEENIPFAKTLAVDPRQCTGDELRSGFTCAKGTLPPTYQKWGLIHYDGWNTLETEEGRWYFDRLDLKVNSLLASGSIPIVMLADPPEWYKKRVKSRGYLGYYYPDTDDETGMALWKKYVRTLGERYKGKVFDYEVFGEAYGRSDPRHYGRLVAIAADDLHAVDPKIQVACNYAGYHDWARGVAKEAAGHANVFTFHPYGWVCGQDPAQLSDETILEPYERFLKESLRQGSGQAGEYRWANTEYGCYQLLATAMRPDGYPMTPEEFDKTVDQKKIGAWFDKRGRGAFVDWYTGAFRAARGYTLNMVTDCKYALWWSSVGGSMIADLQFAPHTPSLESVAYANATGLLTGYRFMRRLDLGAGYLRAYLFQKSEACPAQRGVSDRKSEIPQDYRLVAFTDGREAVVFPEVQGANLQVLDQYANVVPSERAGTTLKFNLRSLTMLFVLGITQVPEQAHPVLGVYPMEKYAYPGLKTKVRVATYNPLDQALEGTVRLKLPAPFAELPVRSVTLAAKESKDLEIEVAVPASVLNNQMMEVEFSTDAKAIGTVTRADTLPIRMSTIAAYTGKPLPVDGDMAKWGNVSQFQVAIDKPEQVIVGIPYTKLYMMDQRVDWTGTKDLAARASVKYDKDNLFIAVRVWDNKVMNLARAEPIYIYEGDCIELFLDGRGKTDQGAPTYTEGVYHIKFAPSMDPKLPPFHHVSKPKRGMEIPGLTYASKLLPDGYTYEIKMPRAAFPGFSFESGAMMGFAMHLGDQDEKGFGEVEGAKVKTIMLWGGEKGVSGDPSKFGKIIFGMK